MLTNVDIYNNNNKHSHRSHPPHARHGSWGFVWVAYLILLLDNIIIPFTTEQSGAQRVTCPRSNSRQASESGFEPRQGSSRVYAHIYYGTLCLVHGPWFQTELCVVTILGIVPLPLTLHDSKRVESAPYLMLSHRVAMTQKNQRIHLWYLFYWS